MIKLMKIMKQTEMVSAVDYSIPIISETEFENEVQKYIGRFNNKL